MKLHVNQLIRNNACQAGCDFFSQHADEEGFSTLERIKEACMAAGTVGQQYWDWLTNLINQPEYFLSLDERVYTNYRVATQECETMAQAQALSLERRQLYPHLIHEWAPMRKITNTDGSGHSWIYLHDERYKAENPLEI